MTKAKWDFDARRKQTMTFTLKFDCNNAAFDGDPTIEITRILRDLASTIETGINLSHFVTVYDINGNDIGRVKLS